MLLELPEVVRSQGGMAANFDLTDINARIPSTGVETTLVAVDMLGLLDRDWMINVRGIGLVGSSLISIQPQTTNKVDVAGAGEFRVGSFLSNYAVGNVGSPISITSPNDPDIQNVLLRFNNLATERQRFLLLKFQKSAVLTAGDLYVSITA